MGNSDKYTSFTLDNGLATLALEIVDSKELLNRYDVQAPRLVALVPDCEHYSCALFQPEPNIEYSDKFVRNGSREHSNQMGEFLKILENKNVNLGVTPEYSFPWKLLENCFQNKRFPAQGNIWVFGAESIDYAELTKIKTSLATENFIFEIGNVRNPELGNFVDPVCYIFRSIKFDGSECYVVFVQCKTKQMGDRSSDYFERNNLQKGSTIFEIKNRCENTISLFTLICSDVLGDEDIYNRFRSRCLLLNIQLNENPRHDSIVTFKKSIYRQITENNEIVCLNWARNIRFATNGKFEQKTSPSSSAVYSTSKLFDLSFKGLVHNHINGMYFCYWDSQKCCVLYLNYDPGIFMYKNTKCWQFEGTPTQMGRTGPESIDFYSWDENNSNWTTVNKPDDAFLDSLEGFQGNFNDLVRLKDNPILVEMALALTFGLTSTTVPHENLKTNNFIKISEPEAPSRITFAQDNSPVA